MSQATIGALRVTLGLDSAAFTDGLTRAQKNMKQVGDRMKAVGATIATVGAGMAVAAGAAFLKLGADALKAADDMGDAAVRIGVTAEAFQKLEIAATSAGAAPGLMTEAMDKLNVGLGAFMQTGGGPAAEAFKQLGLSGQIASGQIKTADEAFYAAARALEGIESPAEKARLSMQLFGRNAGADMLEVLAPGEAALRSYGDAAAASGRIMSNEMVEKLSAAKLTIDTTKQAFMQMAQVMIGDVIVGSMAYIDNLKPMIEQGKALARQVGEFLGPSFKQLATAVQSLMAGPFGKVMVATLRLVAQVIGTVVIVALKAFVDYLTFVAQNLDAAARSIAGFVDDLSGGFRFLSTEVPVLIQRMVDGVTKWLSGKLFEVLRQVISRVKGVSDAFFRLYDAVVGNSYVPDMVDGIAHHMARLQSVMVDPITRATELGAARFEKMGDDVRAVIEGLLTDRERLDMAFASDTAALDDARKSGGITQADYDLFSRRNRNRYASDRAALPNPLRDAMGSVAGAANGGMATVGEQLAKVSGQVADQFGVAADSIRTAFDGAKGAADDFASAFADNMERVLRGDFAGILNDLLSGFLRQMLLNLGKSIGNWGLQQGGGIGALFGSLMGFKDGGSFTVGGSGGIDSQVMAFRATPGEMVDIRKPGQQGGGALAVHVTPSPYFDVQVQRIAGPVAQAAAGQMGRQVLDASRRAAPGLQQRQSRLGTT
jgi:hypothetical protein